MSSLPSPDAIATGREALARAAGLAAFIYGYPLVESMRTCRLQTSGSATEAMRAPIDSLYSTVDVSTAANRDVVTPANDLLYTTAWVNLADGPRILTVPSSLRHAGRYFVLALYDSYTENFENLGPRNCRAEGEKVLLLGPGADAPDGLEGLRVVRSPTQLVWLLGRILVGDDTDLAAARALQADIALAAVSGTNHGRRPTAVEQWPGEPVDVMALVHEHGRSVEDIAPSFFTVLCHALADAPGRAEDRGLVAWLGSGGLAGGSRFAWATLDDAQRRGLIAGFADGANLVAAAARSRNARPWVVASRIGRYGTGYLVRAVTAYIGLGSLAPEEALYAAGNFDAAGHPLTGIHTYDLRFESSDMPPADAFWSVTLYDAADRFLYSNPLNRHSIGDRTRGLRIEADGSLTIVISHEPPADPTNWLPAPAGPFYLMLRMYHPREEARGWKVPPLQLIGF